MTSKKKHPYIGMFGVCGRGRVGRIESLDLKAMVFRGTNIVTGNPWQAKDPRILRDPKVISLMESAWSGAFNF